MNNGKQIFISIDGHGGSGKSTLANQLAKILRAEVVHIDDFTGQGATTDWYKLLINEVITPSITGADSIGYPRAKWWPEHNPEPVINQPVTSIMIIEGVCSSRKELRDYMTIKIFVDTPRNVCIERGIARDKGMGGKSDEEIEAIWQEWIKWDDEYFESDDPKSIADIVADGTKSYDDAVGATLSKLDQATIRNSG